MADFIKLLFESWYFSVDLYASWHDNCFFCLPVGKKKMPPYKSMEKTDHELQGFL